LGPMPRGEEVEGKKRALRVPKDVPAALASRYEMPLLDKAQEQHLFRKMNYLTYKASLLRGKVDPVRARIQATQMIEDLQEAAETIKLLLVRCNMRLVASIPKRAAAHKHNIM